jgi:hypothetical protein
MTRPHIAAQSFEHRIAIAEAFALWTATATCLFLILALYAFGAGLYAAGEIWALMGIVAAVAFVRTTLRRHKIERARERAEAEIIAQAQQEADEGIAWWREHFHPIPSFDEETRTLAEAA